MIFSPNEFKELIYYFTYLTTLKKKYSRRKQKSGIQITYTNESRNYFIEEISQNDQST